MEELFIAGVTDDLNAAVTGTLNPSGLGGVIDSPICHATVNLADEFGSQGFIA